LGEYVKKGACCFIESKGALVDCETGGVDEERRQLFTAVTTFLPIEMEDQKVLL